MPGLNLTPIEKSGRGRGSRKALADIPAEIAETIEEAYGYFQTENAMDRLQTPDFDTKEAADDFLRDARAYAYHREAGRLVVTGNSAKSPTKGKWVARFDVAQYVEDEGE